MAVVNWMLLGAAPRNGFGMSKCLHSLVGAVALAAWLLGLTEAARACSYALNPEFLREGRGCGVSYLADVDRELGLLQPEWREAGAVFGEFDARYIRVPDDQIAAVRAAFRGQLDRLADKGNPIAHVLLGLEDLEDLRTATLAERRILLYRMTLSMAKAMQGGSNSAHVMLVAMFSESQRSAGDFLPVEQLSVEVRACWAAAKAAMPNGRGGDKASSAADPRLWMGRKCIAPTLEALRQ